MNIKNLTKERFFDLILQGKLTGLQIAERISYDSDDYPNSYTHPANKYIISKGDWDKARKKFKLDADTVISTKLEFERRGYRGMLRNLAKTDEHAICSEGVKQGLKYLRPSDVKYFDLLDDQCKELYNEYLMKDSPAFTSFPKRKRSSASSDNSINSEISLGSFNKRIMKLIGLRETKENRDKVSKITSQFDRLGINAAAKNNTEKGTKILEKIKKQIAAAFKKNAKKIQEMLEFEGIEKKKNLYAPSIFSIERLLNPKKRTKTKQRTRAKNPDEDKRVSFPSVNSSLSSIKSIKSRVPSSASSKKSSKSSNSEMGSIIGSSRASSTQNSLF